MGGDKKLNSLQACSVLATHSWPSRQITFNLLGKGTRRVTLNWVVLFNQIKTTDVIPLSYLYGTT